MLVECAPDQHVEASLVGRRVGPSRRDLDHQDGLFLGALVAARHGGQQSTQGDEVERIGGGGERFQTRESGKIFICNVLELGPDPVESLGLANVQELRFPNNPLVPPVVAVLHVEDAVRITQENILGMKLDAIDAIGPEPKHVEMCVSPVLDNPLETVLVVLFASFDTTILLQERPFLKKHNGLYLVTPFPEEETKELVEEGRVDRVGRHDDGLELVGVVSDMGSDLFVQDSIVHVGFPSTRRKKTRRQGLRVRVVAPRRQTRIMRPVRGMVILKHVIVIVIVHHIIIVPGLVVVVVTPLFRVNSPS